MCGTVAARTNTTNLGLTGIPLFIAIELMLYGRGEQTHEEKMSHLGKAYGWIRAYLPVLYEKREDDYFKPRIPGLDKDNNQIKVSIHAVLIEVAVEIETMYNQYQPTYEGQKTCNPDEKKFLKTMRAVFERLALIVTFSGIADRMSNTDEVYF